MISPDIAAQRRIVPHWTFGSACCQIRPFTRLGTQACTRKNTEHLGHRHAHLSGRPAEPDEDHYVWAYQVRIENDGFETVQLRSRHWRITDANGVVQEVRGAGVVGEQPVLEPGESFEYTSGTR